MITAILENYFLKNILFEYILFLKLNLRRLSLLRFRCEEMVSFIFQSLEITIQIFQLGYKNGLLWYCH